MYTEYYGLRELPFELTPNTKFLYLTAGQREALSNLQYGLLAAKPLTLLIGEAGTGKTTLLRAALESDRCRHVRAIYLNNPVLSAEDFVKTLAMRFELGPLAANSKAVLLDALEKTLRQRRERGEITALVVDEAQSLSPALLEEIRLLANIETPTAKLLPLVLAGQPELGERLEEPGLRQLKQRVTLRCELQPFQLTDTASYIGARISNAGGTPARLFTQEAVVSIHEYSRGIPRLVNVICDNALVSGMAARRSPVDRSLVSEVVRDLRLRGDDSAPGAVPFNAGAGEAALAPPPEELDSQQPVESEEDGNGTPPVSHVRRLSWLRLRGSAAAPRYSNRTIT